MDSLPMIPVNKEIYTREYLIPADCFPCNEQVTLYAECSHTSESERDCGYYRLAFFYSVGSYPIRDHLITVFFGEQSMPKAAIDRIIDEHARCTLDETFPEFVAEYLEKEEMWENELDRRYSEEHGECDCEDDED